MRQFGRRAAALLLAAVLAACDLLVPMTAQAAEIVPSVQTRTAPANGWVKTKGATYYYAKGKPASGWKKIKKKWYFFDKETKALATNQIAGDAKKGYYYVDNKGIRVDDEVMNLAVACVRKNTKETMTREEKMAAVYNYFIKKCKYVHKSDKEKLSKMPGYAKEMFRKKKGNCYRGAAALLYCAKALGYETRMGLGSVTSVPDDNWGLSIHGWAEIKVGKKWLICDISMGRRHAALVGNNLYMVQWKYYPFRLKRNKNYLLTASKGKIKWSKEK